MPKELNFEQNDLALQDLIKRAIGVDISADKEKESFEPKI